MLEPVEAEGGSVRFVQLTCERDELFRRVEQESRRAIDKLVDAVRLSELLDRFDMLSPAPFGQHLCLDVTRRAPPDSAMAIVQHYRINRVSSSRLHPEPYTGPLRARLGEHSWTTSSPHDRRRPTSRTGCMTSVSMANT
jgi:hypothetical protein